MALGRPAMRKNQRYHEPTREQGVADGHRCSLSPRPSDQGVRGDGPCRLACCRAQAQPRTRPTIPVERKGRSGASVMGEALVVRAACVGGWSTKKNRQKWSDQRWAAHHQCVGWRSQGRLPTRTSGRDTLCCQGP
ncbi:hypothetical protein AMAG_19578 [Allomyces macrogynus ATCC 38327]|uniref:Uncharacterized protein n=1 Tax=Allomyces macrogynus (strain ATCC 38327) TaxID=578462 RepID=A0A0L0SVE3_ALLM3|nr:hypothetical protein AMAG_19578 [Allomyces macrogynus ATCC 38327]|eukprot:KNE66441.1 hypothetical protein AMAG_19578 [Allomyces macrogynus ATCC 38327]